MRDLTYEGNATRAYTFRGAHVTVERIDFGQWTPLGTRYD